MEVVVGIDGETALTLRPQRPSWPEGDGIVLHEACSRLSCGMTPESSRRRIEAWLEHLVPENGHRERFKSRARKRMRQHGLQAGRLNVGHELWGNCEREYSGKVEVAAYDAKGRRVSEEIPSRRYEPLSEELVGMLVATAGRMAEGGRNVPETKTALRDHGLSGGRGKVCLRWDWSARRWLAPTYGALSTHILKNESEREWLPAEAGIESCCQRALVTAGVEACWTRARLYHGIGTVVSQRSDRVDQGDGGEIFTIHQEEWSQAIGLYPEEKKVDDRPETEWPSLLRLLGRYGQDAEWEQRKLCKAIAAVVLLGNGDTHRRNVGIRHVWGAEGRKVVLAPLYDCSSVEGVAWTNVKRMEIPVGGEVEFDNVKGEQWARLAHAGSVDTGLVLDSVREVAERLPDALREAAEEAKREDIVANPKARDRRMEEIGRYATERCARALTELGTRAQRRQAGRQRAPAPKRPPLPKRSQGWDIG